MSFNVYLNRPKCCDRCDCNRSVDVGDPTYNISAMFTLALGHPLRDLHGQRAGEHIENLARATAHIRTPANATAYTALNASNGWGKHEDAAEFLERLLEQCRAYPDATIRIT